MTQEEPKATGPLENAPPQPAAGAKATRPAGRKIDMRGVHRILSLIACLFLLYVGVTGTLIQTVDIKTLLSGAPESDRTMQSINEGKFGNGYYSAVTRADWKAAPLPADVDVAKSMAVTLAAFHKAVPGKEPTFVELRMRDGKVVGQAAYPNPNPPPGPRRGPPPLMAKAFDATTGAPVAAIDIERAVPEKSLRQTLKQWHRFWGPDFVSKRDVPGIYFELGVGITMWVLIVTGLVTYFRLLKQRRKMGRKNLFWMTSEKWRGLHRGVSVSAAILLILVAASGTWLGFESVWNSLGRRGPPAKAATMKDEQVRRIAATTLKAFRADEPQTPIKTIRARIWGGEEEGAIVTGGDVIRQRVFATKTGKEMALSEPHYANNGFPLGMDVHEWVKHFHSGYLFGLPARFLDLLAGLALVFLSISGLVMYIQMYRKRASAGRKALFWK